VIGAKGRSGTGACDLCDALGLPLTRWDMAETAHGGPLPEILAHDVFLNCILASDGVPVFVPDAARTAPRRLAVIGDIACDPGSDFSPVKVYDTPTDRERPVLRVHDAPALDVMAIDNLPSLLPRESSEDFAAQLLPVLMTLDRIDEGPWARARDVFDRHLGAL
jgi:saccharopine dehydrogenase (NAD+, L-lysine-forming)